MNVRHLRAKYQIEQYPVVFAFPEQVLYEPTVRVEVVSGVDPNPAAFAGLPFVDGNLVAVLVAGGVPGVIYRIVCAVELSGEIVELSGVIAVKDTQATTPEGTSALPLTLTVTTPPYPAFVFDSVNVLSNTLPGMLIDIPAPIDNLDIYSYALDGELRELTRFYDFTESVQITSTALNGVLVIPIIPYTLSESIQLSSMTRDGVLRLVVIQYLNYIPEKVQLTSYALNGSLL